MTKIGIGRFGAALAAVALLTACQGDQQPFGFLKKKDGTPATAASAATSAAGTPELITVIGGDHDVEAPETFKLTDKALWDGRPSLGGVWVAHASVKDPERVIIRNPANGKSVVGALFRREVDNPGPSLQLSSDAADALGLLAGQPGTIDVVALRRVEAEVPAEAEVATEAEVPAEATAPEAAAQTDPGAEPAVPAADAGTPALAPKVKKPWWKRGKKTPEIKSTGIVQKPLDPIAANAAAAIDAAEAAKAPEAAPAATLPQPTPEPEAALKRAYVQIGIFSVEANANKAAAQMKKAGMTATVKPDTSQGKTFWRVIIGPAASVAERDALAAKVKGLGYPDAYPVSN